MSLCHSLHDRESSTHFPASTGTISRLLFNPLTPILGGREKGIWVHPSPRQRGTAPLHFPLEIGRLGDTPTLRPLSTPGPSGKVRSGGCAHQTAERSVIPAQAGIQKGSSQRVHISPFHPFTLNSLELGGTPKPSAKRLHPSPHPHHLAGATARVALLLSLIRVHYSETLFVPGITAFRLGHSICSQKAAPGGTMGYTFSSGSTMKSIRNGPG